MSPRITLLVPYILKENQKHLLKLIKLEWTMNGFGIVVRYLSYVITVHNSDGSRLPSMQNTFKLEN